MAPKSAGCRQIGAVVRARAAVVTNSSERVRIFGSKSREATVTGTVVEVVTPQKGSGKQASVVVDWNLGSRIKRKAVKVMNVRLASSQPIAPGPSISPTVTLDQGVTSQESQPEIHNVAPLDEVVVHGVSWTEGRINSPLNGYVTAKPWKVTNITGKPSDKVSHLTT